MLAFLLEYLGDQPWKREANCSGLDMYPEALQQSMGPRSPQYIFSEEEKVTKSVCWDCPVRLICLEYALDHKEKYGVWGGLTELQRADIVQLYKNRSFELAKKHAAYTSEREAIKGNNQRRQRNSRPPQKIFRANRTA